MTTTQFLILALSAVAVAGVAGAFVIVFRRSSDAGDAKFEEQSEESALAMAIVAGGTDKVAAESSVDGAAGEATPNPVVHAVAVVRLEELSPEEAGVSRRQFFTRALGLTFGAFLGLNALAYLAFLWPRLSGGFGSDIDVGAVADIRRDVVLADGSVLPKFVPEARAYIVPFDSGDVSRSQFGSLGVVAGELTALFQRCVHLGCRVPWCESSQGFECPCHGSKYNFLGEYTAGPAPRNLDRFAVEEVNGRLIVKTGTILQTARATAKTVKYPQGPSCIALNAGEE